MREKYVKTKQKQLHNRNYMGERNLERGAEVTIEEREIWRKGQKGITWDERKICED